MIEKDSLYVYVNFVAAEYNHTCIFGMLKKCALLICARFRNQGYESVMGTCRHGIGVRNDNEDRLVSFLWTQQSVVSTRLHCSRASRQTVCKRKQIWCFPIGWVMSSTVSLNADFNWLKINCCDRHIVSKHIASATRNFTSEFCERSSHMHSLLSLN